MGHVQSKETLQMCFIPLCAQLILDTSQSYLAIVGHSVLLKTSEQNQISLKVREMQPPGEANLQGGNLQ